MFFSNFNTKLKSIRQFIPILLKNVIHDYYLETVTNIFILLVCE